MGKIYHHIQPFLRNHIGLAILFFFICLSEPFLKIPYDVWDHLIKIRNIYDHGDCYLYWPDDPSFMCFWNFLWAGLFKILNINDTLIWAKMIHVSQFIFAAWAIYYYSSTVIHVLRPDINKIHLNLLSYIAVLLWFSGNGTFSIVHQQAWIMWYSVNYQGFTLPLFWYLSAIAIQIFFQNPGKLKRIFIVLQIIFISAVISVAHPSEQLYFFIHVTILCVIQYKNLLSFRARTYIYIAFALVAGIVLFILLFKFRIIPMPMAIQNMTWAEMLNRIQWIGSLYVDDGWNRFPNSFSEIAFLSIFLAVIYRISILTKSEQPAIRRCYDYLLISSCLFFIIPLTRITSGIIGYVTFIETVWRFVYASPWFILLPYITYRLIVFFNRRVTHSIIIANAVVIIGVFLLSKYLFYQAFSGNIQSLISSLDSRRVGIQYSNEDLKKLLHIIEDHERLFARTNKPNLLYMRSDLGIIAKAVYGRDVYMTKVRMPHLSMESFYNGKLDTKYHLIDVNVPSTYPKDREISKYFKIDKVSLSKKQHFVLPKEIGKLVTNIDDISQDRDYLRISGWAFIEDQSSRGQEVYIVMQSNHGQFIFDSSVNYRSDVANHFDRLNLDESGFIATIKKNDIQKGLYRIRLCVRGVTMKGYIWGDVSRTIKID